ncbi:hypothetical protein ACFS6H_15095 [Terrimonas rubra]|uniref:DUF4878 domain-containing protein n=1 Tax=Terrimonas rubra TaxID=1035890 RepID=A0ABW6A9H3_9BACT
MLKQCLSAFLFILLLSVGVSSCSSVDKSDPKSVLQAFFDKLSKKDVDGAMALATESSQTTLGLMKMAINMAQDGKAAEKKDFADEFKDVSLGEPKIDGDKATVTLTPKKEQKTVDFILKKEGGSWKVDFSLEALMKMGLNGRGAEGRRSDADTLIDQFDEETLKRANDVADSILKNMDPKKLEEYQKEGKALLEKYKENN